MNIESLEKRKEELKAEQLQLVANANALSGAIQDIDYWIAVLKAETSLPSTTV